MSQDASQYEKTRYKISLLEYRNDAIRHPSPRLSSFNFANLTCQLVEIDYIRLILPNFTSWHVIFAKLKLLENTKPSICDTLIYIPCSLSVRQGQSKPQQVSGGSLLAHFGQKKTKQLVFPALNCPFYTADLVYLPKSLGRSFVTTSLNDSRAKTNGDQMQFYDLLTVILKLFYLYYLAEYNSCLSNSAPDTSHQARCNHKQY